MDKIKQGDKFGRWTVNYCLNKNNKKYWNCTCDCGTNKDVAQSSLIYEKSKSCGCLSKELSADRSRQNFTPNNIIMHENYIEVILGNYKEKTCLIDIEDYEKIKNYRWFFNKKRNCIQANKRKNKNKRIKGTIKIHKIIMDCPYNMTVDHINHDIFDNRKSNLRICTNQENSWNKNETVSNTSGHKGIYDDTSRSRFQAYINKNKKRIRKNFPYNENNKEEIYKSACEWREQMDKELFGEFSYYNSVVDNQQ